MPKKASKSQPKMFLEIAIKSTMGKHVSRISSVAELREEIQRFLPTFDAYAAQAAAHLVVLHKANIDGGTWHIQITGEYVFKAVGAAQKQRSKAHAEAAPMKETAPVPVRGAAQVQPSPAPLFPPEEPEA